MPVTRAIVACLALVAAFGLAPAAARADIRRGAEVRHVEYLGDRVARITFSAFEQELDVRYPLTTIGRESLQVELSGAPQGADIRSLMTVGSAPGNARRAMVMAFYGGALKQATAPQELRSSLADFLPKLPSRFLAVGVSGGEGKQPIDLVGESSPDGAENIVLFQRAILDAQADADGFARADGLCFAAERFAGWDLGDFQPNDQKVAVIVGVDRLAGEAPDAGCAAKLAALGVRVFEITWTNALGATTGGSGFNQRIKSPIDVAAALSNIAANLNGEYTLDVELPDVPKTAQPLTISLVVGYNGQALRAAPFKMTATIPELNEREPVPPPVPPASPLPYAAGAVVGLTVLVLAGAWARRRLKNAECNACGRLVDKTHKRCPFRASDVAARLVVLDGPMAGRTLALRPGDSSIGRAPTSPVALGGRGVAWHRHGVITVEGNRVLYTPRRGAGVDRVNGWPVTEARLLGAGYVLQIGERKLRLEMRSDAGQAQAPSARDSGSAAVASEARWAPRQERR